MSVYCEITSNVLSFYYLILEYIKALTVQPRHAAVLKRVRWICILIGVERVAGEERAAVDGTTNPAQSMER